MKTVFFFCEFFKFEIESDFASRVELFPWRFSLPVDVSSVRWRMAGQTSKRTIPVDKIVARKNFERTRNNHRRANKEKGTKDEGNHRRVFVGPVSERVDTDEDLVRKRIHNGKRWSSTVFLVTRSIQKTKRWVDRRYKCFELFECDHRDTRTDNEHR